MSVLTQFLKSQILQVFLFAPSWFYNTFCFVTFVRYSLNRGPVVGLVPLQNCWTRELCHQDTAAMGGVKCSRLFVGLATENSLASSASHSIHINKCKRDIYWRLCTIDGVTQLFFVVSKLFFCCVAMWNVGDISRGEYLDCAKYKVCTNHTLLDYFTVEIDSDYRCILKNHVVKIRPFCCKYELFVKVIIGVVVYHVPPPPADATPAFITQGLALTSSK